MSQILKLRSNTRLLDGMLKALSFEVVLDKFANLKEDYENYTAAQKENVQTFLCIYSYQPSRLVFDANTNVVYILTLYNHTTAFNLAHREFADILLTKLDKEPEFIVPVITTKPRSDNEIGVANGYPSQELMFGLESFEMDDVYGNTMPTVVYGIDSFLVGSKFKNSLLADVLKRVNTEEYFEIGDDNYVHVSLTRINRGNPAGTGFCNKLTVRIGGRDLATTFIRKEKDATKFTPSIGFETIHQNQLTIDIPVNADNYGEELVDDAWYEFIAKLLAKFAEAEKAKDVKYYKVIEKLLTGGVKRKPDTLEKLTKAFKLK